MKYHCQFVSRTTVRIELIPEDQKEIALLEELSLIEQDSEELQAIFSKGVKAYNANATLTKHKFMNFPKVALCSYTATAQTANKVA